VHPVRGSAADCARGLNPDRAVSLSGRRSAVDWTRAEDDLSIGAPAPRPPPLPPLVFAADVIGQHSGAGVRVETGQVGGASQDR